MLQPHEERNVLVEKITSAFDGVDRGDGVTWREAEEIDNHAEPQERVRARDLDTDKKWQDVEAGLFERYPSALTFLDAIGFRYYLPAVMIWSLRYGETSEAATVDNLLSLLNAPRWQRWCEELLTVEQRRVVAHFVEFMVREYWRNPSDQSRNLLHYWREGNHPD